MARFDNKVALVTGASRGIGRGVALRLAGEGADVVVNYRSHPDEAAQVCDQIAGLGRRALAIQADVADRAAMEQMFAQAAETLDVPDRDRAQWQAFASPNEPTWILCQPDIYWREADVLVTGFKS